MRGLRLQERLGRCGNGRPLGLIWFANAGDPTDAATWDILQVLAGAGVHVVELCVPFPRSISDGPAIRASHDRALAGGGNFNRALGLAARAVDELRLEVVLLADYAHTVAPLGLEQFVAASATANVAATLIHGLPAPLRAAYAQASRALGLGVVTTFFSVSQPTVRQAAYREGEGYAYVVSRYGRTGGSGGIDAQLVERLRLFRTETSLPLAVGFGVRTPADILALAPSGVNAVIVGSAGIRIIEQRLLTPSEISSATALVVRELMDACKTSTEATVEGLRP